MTETQMSLGGLAVAIVLVGGFFALTACGQRDPAPPIVDGAPVEIPLARKVADLPDQLGEMWIIVNPETGCESMLIKDRATGAMAIGPNTGRYDGYSDIKTNGCRGGSYQAGPDSH